MAIYHLSIQMISRSSGRSSVGAAAYRAGEKIVNEYDGMTHDYRKKGGIVHTEVLLPENAPPEYFDRSKLWNAVERIEKRKDAQTAREIEIALPVELPRSEQIKLMHDYIQESFVNVGMCADIAIHDKRDGNPHAHIMLTTRHIDITGFGQKNREWNNLANAEAWRAAWAKYCNEALERQRSPERIDHRSFERQGQEKLPTIHLGSTAHQLEKRGIETDRGNENRRVQILNAEIAELLQQEQELIADKTQIKILLADRKQHVQEINPEKFEANSKEQKTDLYRLISELSRIKIPVTNDIGDIVFVVVATAVLAVWVSNKLQEEGRKQQKSLITVCCAERERLEIEARHDRVADRMLAKTDNQEMKSLIEVKLPVLWDEYIRMDTVDILVGTLNGVRTTPEVAQAARTWRDDVNLHHLQALNTAIVERLETIRGQEAAAYESWVLNEASKLILQYVREQQQQEKEKPSNSKIDPSPVDRDIISPAVPETQPLSKRSPNLAAATRYLDKLLRGLPRMPLTKALISISEAWRKAIGTGSERERADALEREAISTHDSAMRAHDSVMVKMPFIRDAIKEYLYELQPEKYPPTNLQDVKRQLRQIEWLLDARRKHENAIYSLKKEQAGLQNQLLGSIRHRTRIADIGQEITHLQKQRDKIDARLFELAPRFEFDEYGQPNAAGAKYDLQQQVSQEKKRLELLEAPRPSIHERLETAKRMQRLREREQTREPEDRRRDRGPTLG